MTLRRGWNTLAAPAGRGISGGNVAPVRNEEICAAVAGRTVALHFRDTVEARGGEVALRWLGGAGASPGVMDGPGQMTWAEYAEQACRLASGLAALGVCPGDRVVLMMRNRPEFHVADVGVTLAGGTPVSIYNSSSPEQVEYLAGHCEAVAAIVGDIGMLERFLKVRSELP